MTEGCRHTSRVGRLSRDREGTASQPAEQPAQHTQVAVQMDSDRTVIEQ